MLDCSSPFVLEERSAMDYERLLINKVAQTSRIENLLLDGIREEHFYDLELRKIFLFMVEHYKKYKQPPSFNTVKTQFSLHNFEIIDESVDYIKDKFIKQLKWRFAVDSIRDIAGLLDDPEKCEHVEEIFLERSRALAQLVPSANMARLSNLEERLLEYEKPLDGTQGIKMGIPAFDNVCLCIQPYEYVSIIGASGSGKSTLAQYLLMNAYLQNKTPMYISLEMESGALMRKWDTMLVDRLSYMELKAHTLEEKSKKALQNKAAELKKKVNEYKTDILVLDDVRNCTVDRVYAELVRWKPDICCIDYISLMDSHKQGTSWEQTMYITQSLKQTARTLKVPIIGVAQTNRSSFQDGPQADNVAGSISIIQDSDIVLGLFSDRDMEKEKRMQVRMLKNRDGMTRNTDLKWDMETMSFEPWRASHVFN